LNEVVHSPALARFESFEVNLRSGELYKDGEKIKLPEQSFRILVMLLERPGEVVLRHEIQKRLWPNDTVVEFENSINSAIKKLRLALGDVAASPRYVETLARRGYRWKGPVEWAEPSPAKPATEVSQQTPPLSPYLAGKRVAHYRVLEILGGGGMGIVYKAEDLKLGRLVALKFLPEELGQHAKARERFEREARVASALDHRNICAIHEFGEHAGQPFIVMPFLQGETLRERIAREAPLPMDALLDIARQVADGLAAAHEKAIIHRDIKPSNIFLTNRGEAKILDFGLATLEDPTTAGENDGPATARSAKPTSATALHLTRTGTALGTAAYMSPEQVRGEKLDSRTDLFSFGLVLYEMAVGQRAFAGDSDPMLHAAIQNEAPRAVRTVNPEVPVELEGIIHKALEKNRKTRYQTAAEIRRDLTAVPGALAFGGGASGTSGALGKLWPLIAAAILALLLVAAMIGYRLVGVPPWKQIPMSNERTENAPGSGYLKQQRLTSNSSENPVVSGVLSPDGTLLAYSDVKGIHIQQIDTGSIQDVPMPANFKGTPESWLLVDTWVRDGSAIIANAAPSGLQPSIWLVPVTGGSIRKIRDNGMAWALSHDGQWIAFGANLGSLYYRELWTMRTDGTDAHKVFDAESDTAFGGADFSPDGRRLAYVKLRQLSDRGEMTFESRPLEGGPATLAIGDLYPRFANDWAWSPNGRIIYSLIDSEERTCNFWQVKLDTQTGEPVEKPTRLTNWSGFRMDDPGFSADGRRLSFLRSSLQSTLYVADLRAGGTELSTPVRLTLNEGWNVPLGWSEDSKTIVYLSDRNGHSELLRQADGEESVQSIATLEDSPLDARISADGAWVFYLSPPKGWGSAQRVGLMKMPITGGAPQLLLTSSYGADPGLRCARHSSAACILAEQTSDHTALVFTEVDPVRGRGRERARFGMEATAAAQYDWDLSPDGTRIAILQQSEATITLLSLSDNSTLHFSVEDRPKLFSLDWSADGDGLFVSALANGGFTLFHLDLNGNAQRLWYIQGGIRRPGDLFLPPLAPSAVPSPDGRHVVIQSQAVNANMWLLENF